MKNLVIPFLGRRSYVHSTSLLEALPAILPPKARFSLKILRPMHGNAVAIRPLEEEASPDAVWMQDDRAWALRASPAGAELREPYDEDGLLQETGMDGRGASWQADAGPIFRMGVAILKRLLLDRRPGGAPGQWLFVRMDGRMPLPVSGSMRLNLLSATDSAAMARILHDGSPWATLYFGRGAPAPQA